MLVEHSFLFGGRDFLGWMLRTEDEKHKTAADFVEAPTTPAGPLSKILTGAGPLAHPKAPWLSSTF